MNDVRDLESPVGGVERSLPANPTRRGLIRRTKDKRRLNWHGRRTSRHALPQSALGFDRFAIRIRPLCNCCAKIFQQISAVSMTTTGISTSSAGTSGKRYRVRHGRQMNVDELDNTGRLVRGLCFLPEGWLSTGDILLAQKIALELREANAFSGARPSSVPGTELGAVERARGSRSNPSFV